MNVGGLTKRPIVMQAALERSRLCIYALIAAFVCAVGVIVVGLSGGSARKIDANGLMSPWDRSSAPPAFLSRASVRVIVAPPRTSPTPSNVRAKPGPRGYRH